MWWPHRRRRERATSRRGAVASVCRGWSLRSECLDDPFARPAVPSLGTAYGRGPLRGGNEAWKGRRIEHELIRALGDGDRPLGVVAHGEARDAERGRLLLQPAG